jgi:dihydropteroate synthase
MITPGGLLPEAVMSRDRRWKVAGRELSLHRPLIIGVVNVTPDSFSDGGRFFGGAAAVAHGERLMAEGADLVDVGGESTRPGAEPVDEEEELRRVMPVLSTLAEAGALVSIDTAKPSVAKAALAAGAVVVNDVTGGSDPEMARVVAAARAGVILMHMQGTPRTMQINPAYRDVVGEVAAFLSQRAELAEESGVDHDAIAVDPGIGFGKSLDHNLTLLRDLSAFTRLGYPVAVGTSRKAFLGSVTGVTEPTDRDLATAVSSALAVERGADLIRVHNVSACKEAVAVALAIVRGSGG